ncbi:nitroreductase family protein [Clostridium estertheticum]|uniref:nitroreductase family protein n=1 Tax=Clostridium estertheticum TaxID=238834 RepID=UPI001C0AB014|nr:nitroreductase [Clostridium estertheticum]MBU3171176.1 nitroreductase [Clostridium estertheticum]
MNICDCINNRRSIRMFTDQEVNSDVIDELIALGTKAATGSGNEAWGFVVITDKNEMKKISDKTKKYLLKNFEKHPYFKQYESWLNNEKFNTFYNAPCLILIYGDTDSHWNVYDCTLAAGNIMNAAMEYKLGTCWIGFAEHVCGTEEFKLKYKIPANYNLVSSLIVGYPKVQLPSPSRKPAKIFFKR